MDQNSNGIRRPNSTLAERARWAARFRRSGLSQSAFAKRHDLNLFTLRKWLEGQRPAPSLKKKTFPRRKIPALALREISLGSVLGAKWAAEIILPSGVTVRLGAEAAPWLAQTLLRSLPC
jgi:hypothetical protein